MSITQQEDFNGRPSTLQKRCNQLNRKYDEEEAKRKFIETVAKNTEEIRKDYINDNGNKETEHKSILDDFQL